MRGRARKRENKERFSEKMKTLQLDRVFDLLSTQEQAVEERER